MLEEFKKRKLEEFTKQFIRETSGGWTGLGEVTPPSEDLIEFDPAKYLKFISDLIGEAEEEMKLNMAEQQLLGFHHRNVGYEIESLCEDMGLTKKEFDELREQGMIEYLTDEERKDIENFIINL